MAKSKPATSAESTEEVPETEPAPAPPTPLEATDALLKRCELRGHGPSLDEMRELRAVVATQ